MSTAAHLCFTFSRRHC